MAVRRRTDRSPEVPLVRVAPLGELRVYQVTEGELDEISRGSPGSIFLNFALVLVPLSVSFLLTLTTTRIEPISLIVFFVCACLICFILGVLFAFLAWHYHASVKNTIATIKNRMPPPPNFQGPLASGTVPDRPISSEPPSVSPPETRP